MSDKHEHQWVTESDKEGFVVDIYCKGCNIEPIDDESWQDNVGLEVKQGGKG